jgi:hypothetical protein
MSAQPVRGKIADIRQAHAQAVHAEIRQKITGEQHKLQTIASNVKRMYTDPIFAQRPNDASIAKNFVAKEIASEKEFNESCRNINTLMIQLGGKI